MHIAVLVRGISYEPCYSHRSGWKYCIDYISCIDSFKENIIDSFESRGHSVDTYVASYSSPVTDDIVSDYEAKAYDFTEKEGFDQRKTLLRGIDLLLANGGDSYDLILITRFDIVYKREIAPFIDAGFFNICFKDVSDGVVSDLMQAFPGRMLKDFKSCIEMNRGWLHGMLKQINEVFGQESVRYMVDGKYRSNASIRHNPNPMLYIHRHQLPQNYTHSTAQKEADTLFNNVFFRLPTKEEKRACVRELMNDKTNLVLKRRALMASQEFIEMSSIARKQVEDCHIEMMGKTDKRMINADIDAILKKSCTLEDIKKRYYKSGHYRAFYKEEQTAMKRQVPGIFRNCLCKAHAIAKELKDGRLTEDSIRQRYEEIKNVV